MRSTTLIGLDICALVLAFTALAAFTPPGSERPRPPAATNAPPAIAFTPGELLILQNQQILDAKLDAILRGLPRTPYFRAPTNRITI